MIKEMDGPGPDRTADTRSSCQDHGLRSK